MTSLEDMASFLGDPVLHYLKLDTRILVSLWALLSLKIILKASIILTLILAHMQNYSNCYKAIIIATMRSGVFTRSN